MKAHRLLPALLLSIIALSVSTFAQSTFDLEAYKQFLRDNEDISSAQLRGLYPAGTFAAGARSSFDGALYADSIDHYYKLTPYERSLIERNGFMVTERLQERHFGGAFTEIYNRDLPVFVSTDAILHALHMSYDAVLKDVERRALIPRLKSLLGGMHARVATISVRYKNDARMMPMLRDIDVYTSVALRLLRVSTTPNFPENAARIDEILEHVKDQTVVQEPLFSDAPRIMDYSQFTPRGHYTEDEQLTAYFQSMIWLGRTELYLIAPKSHGINPSKEDVRRQAIDATLLLETMTDEQYKTLDEIDAIIVAMVGESDNVTMEHMKSLVAEARVASAADLLDDVVLDRFQTTLATKPFAGQRINSQILMSDPMVSEQLEPASAMMLLGQRFVIDSYVTGSVVYDKIIYKGEKQRRMLPSTLDILFALGNDAAAQLLIPELDRYHYGDHLAGLRYLVDSHGEEFWNASLYNTWLDAIRTLNPPRERESLPPFMRTAAWWQQKMNTQLASWAQLRHDNLLYAKQSYSGGIGCSFPKSLVEPVPEFYATIGRFASNARARLLPLIDTSMSQGLDRYFTRMAEVADTLESIARKELKSEALSSDEELFLQHMLVEKTIGCGEKAYDGWYVDLYYTGKEGLTTDDKVVADVHTAPTDADGAMVGWVLHGGTGPLNMAVVTCQMPNGESVAFIGPVMSYYEHVSTNFKRLTDQEWKQAYAQAPSFRPALVNIYLADSTGSSRGEAPSLIAPVRPEPAPSAGATIDIGMVAPNPTSGSTTIGFSIPPSLGNKVVDVVVTDATGREVRRLLGQQLPAGGYTVEWDGASSDGTVVADGIYFVTITSGGVQSTAKVSRVR